MSATYEWRGQIYTMRDLTKATGLTRHVVRYHFDKHGHLDNLGTATTDSGLPMPYWIGGRVYPSQGTIARIIGEHRQTVQRWIAEGKTDRIVEKLRETRA